MGQLLSLPTWFLTAIAAADLPEGAPPNQVQARLADAVQLLDWLRAQALELFVRRGNAASAWAALEAGLLEVLLGAVACLCCYKLSMRRCWCSTATSCLCSSKFSVSFLSISRIRLRVKGDYRYYAARRQGT